MRVHDHTGFRENWWCVRTKLDGAGTRIRIAVFVSFPVTPYGYVTICINMYICVSIYV